MPCYQPLLRIEYPNIKYMNKNGKISTKASIHTTTDTELEDIIDGKETIKMLIPCGQCIGCRLDYSRQWANRGYLESLLHAQNYFITLTYDNEHLPMKDFTIIEDKIYPRTEEWKGTLNKRDLQLFFKRLRDRIPKFSYMACGEYGSENGRPHYHAILFGAELPTETFYNPRLINHEFYYQNDIIEECWTEEVGRGKKTGKSLGYSNISEANWNTIAYTARYVVKKQMGIYADEEYKKRGQEKEFITVSKNPAIGKEYFNLHHMDIMENDKIMIHNKNGTYEVTRPRYYDKLIEKYHEEELKETKAKRKKIAQELAELKDTTTSLKRKQQLEVEERTQKQKTAQLLRPLDKKVVKDTIKRKETERPRPRREKDWMN